MPKGSHATWGDMPRVCAGCGQPLRITKDDLWLDTDRRESWHMNCRLMVAVHGAVLTSGRPGR